MFQSTRPRGARRDSGSVASRRRVVSIHAPARGATGNLRACRACPEFQSTRPRGARPSRSRPRSWIALFQSTRPRGARHAQCPGIAVLYFVSIHAPARGATVFRLFEIIVGQMFQSTRPRGARRDGLSTEGVRPPFQSTRPRGARRHQRGCAGIDIRRFNPRAREGRDTGDPLSSEFLTVSIHAPARGATYLQRETIDKADVSIHAPARGATPRFFCI